MSEPHHAERYIEYDAPALETLDVDPVLGLGQSDELCTLVLETFERLTHEEAARRCLGAGALPFLVPAGVCSEPSSLASPFYEGKPLRHDPASFVARWNLWVEVAFNAGLLTAERAIALRLREAVRV